LEHGTCIPRFQFQFGFTLTETYKQQEEERDNGQVSRFRPHRESDVKASANALATGTGRCRLRAQARTALFEWYTKEFEKDEKLTEEERTEKIDETVRLVMKVQFPAEGERGKTDAAQK
jgi:hypothetical protein